MNRIYRLVWNRHTSLWAVASELARSRVKGGGSAGVCGGVALARSGGHFPLKRSVLAGAFGLLLGGVVQAADLPTGGQIVAGAGSISQNGSSLTVQQDSSKLIAHWQSFDIGVGHSVHFQQPSTSSVALNRVLGNNGSEIYGSLTANGQVFLINPNGILFAEGASVNVGGLVASTLDIQDDDFLNGHYRFAQSPDKNPDTSAGISNRGSITADGGAIALLGAQISNNGLLQARLGSVVLAAGNSVTLDFAGDGLLNVQIDEGQLNALIENHGAIKADGGQVILTTHAADQLLNTVVNNSGLVQARTVEERDGKIILLADLQTGTAHIVGTLDASAPTTGDGGFIETSGATVKIADGTKITTKAEQGKTGSWLIDPQDFTIAASGGDISGATLSAQLADNDITIQSVNGASEGNGDIFVNDSITWSQNTLTLSAERNIEIHAEQHASGTAGLALEYGQANPESGNTATYSIKAPVNLASTGSFSTKLGSDGTSLHYTIITELGNAGDELSAGNNTLQGLAHSSKLSGNYVLGANIDATPTASWNAEAGFSPIGSNSSSHFSGIFDGLGHTISNLVIDRPDTDNIGLFGFVAMGGVVRDLVLQMVSITGSNYVGSVAGFNYQGVISNVAASSGELHGYNDVGGLVGRNAGTVSQAWASINTESIGLRIGGLVGTNDGYISHTWASGAVSGSGLVGGLVGINNHIIDMVYATGSVAGGGAGGLVGSNFGTVTNAWASGAITSESGGGLVGENFFGGVTSSYWATDSSGQASGAGSGETDGIFGLTLAQLQAALPTGFSTSIWANGNNASTPYLKGMSLNVGYLASDPGTTNQYRILGDIAAVQSIANDLSGHYALAWDIDASATANWHGGAGFKPIGDSADYFSGVLDGLGYTISGLIINRPSELYVGLFGYTHSSSVINNLGLVDADIVAAGIAGALAGFNAGLIGNSYALATVTGTGFSLGGLVGSSTGTISGSHAIATVQGKEHVGGLVGNGARSVIRDSYAIATVTGVSQVGGLVGNTFYSSQDRSAVISDSYAIATVTGAYRVGGLVGKNAAAVSRSHAAGTVTGVVGEGDTEYFTGVGGLVGLNLLNSITDSYAMSDVVGNDYVGGLVGYHIGAWGLRLQIPSVINISIMRSYATGNVVGNDYVGGLVGYNADRISDTYAMGSVTGNSYVGGLVGYSDGEPLTVLGRPSNLGYSAIIHSYATGWVSGSGIGVGGLLGQTGSHGSSPSLSYWATDTTGQATSASGGTGLTLAQLQSALPSGFNSSIWANGNNASTPYLKGLSLNVGYLASDPGTTNPYRILGDIAAVQSMVNDLSGHYALAWDIDASATANWHGGAGFKPIGNNTNYFSGVLDGLGYTINGLTINRPDEDFVGLFGYVAGGAVRNLGLVDADITGRNRVGSLVGYLNGGSLAHVFADDLHLWAAGDESGGLVGVIAGGGSLADAWARGAVTGQNSVGGLVGYIQGGSIAASWSDVAVGGLNQVGGLLGHNNGANTGSLYSLGQVSATGIHVGGLVGALTNGGRLENAYATGVVAGVDYVGGLLGLNDSGVLMNAWTSGPVAADGSHVGGLVGRNIDSTITNAYWVTDTTPVAAGVGGGSNTGITGLTLAQLQAALPAGFGSIWANAGNQSTPYLLSGTRQVAYIVTDPGAVNLYDIVQTLAQLQSINKGLAGRYALGAHIDATDTAVWNEGQGFVPVGDNSTKSSASRFAGVFDGLGYTISDLTINQSSCGACTQGDHVGLFGYVDGATIRNIGLDGGRIDGRDVVGALVGYSSDSMISNAWSSADVGGRSELGGLVGIHASGTITNAYATGNVTGSGNEIGGLVGVNHATITNSWAGSSVSGGVAGGLVGVHESGAITHVYATGNVNGTSTLGGLVGRNKSAITNAWASGDVGDINGNSYLGGLVGVHASGTISNVHATGTVTGSSYLGGLVGSSSSVVAQAWASGDVNGRPHSDYVGGLVGRATDGSITNAHAAGSVTGRNYAGGLVGSHDNGAITDVHASGSVSGNDHVGGLAGSSSGTVEGASASGNVSGNDRVGGLAGSSSGTIEGASASGNVSGNNRVGGLLGFHEEGLIQQAWASGDASGYYHVGGLVGLTSSSSVVTSVYASGDVSGTSYLGGLVGFSIGTITNAYATGNVDGISHVGGLAGTSNSTITNVWASGEVSGTSFVGGLLGISSNDMTTNAYWVTDTTTAAGGVGDGSAVGITGRTLAQLQSALPSGFSTSVWANGNNASTPYLKGLSLNVGYLASDPGTTNQYRILGDSAAVQSMANDLAGHYALAWDIDASATANWHGGAGFKPIGNNTNYFSGVLNGLGYTISSLTINRPDEDFVGLFGYVARGAVQNLGLANADITGRSRVGSLVGYLNNGRLSAVSSLNVRLNAGGDYAGGLVGISANQARIEHAGVTGDSEVGGENFVGGLVGYAHSNSPILSSWAYVTVSGRNQVGGLLGYNNGVLVEDGAAWGMVNASGTYVGGLVGVLSNGGSIVSGIADVDVSSPEHYVGGLVGYVDLGTTVENSFATGAVSGLHRVGGLVAYNRGTIHRSWAYGDVTATGTYIGGLVGVNASSGVISESAATGNVGSTQHYVGGLVGYNHVGGVISDVIATGVVNGISRVGGLIGWHGGSLANGLSIGLINAGYYYGGLIGFDGGGSVTASFWDVDTSGQTASAGGMGLDTETLWQMGTYSAAGWNIGTGAEPATIWRIDDGAYYPLLGFLSW